MTPPGSSSSSPAPARPPPLKRVAPDTTAGGRRKRRAVDTTPDPLAFWEEFGRIFGRQHNFFDACGTIMERGMELAYDVEDAEDAGTHLELSGPDRRILESWRALSAVLEKKAPDAVTDAQLASKIADRIDKGVSAAKTADTHSMKTQVPVLLAKLYGTLDPPIFPNEKKGRGYDHKVTAKLLCPVTMQFTEENRLSLFGRTVKVPGDVFPRFLYKNMDFFDQDKAVVEAFLNSTPWDGFLRHEILIMFFKLIFISPSSADKDSEEHSTATRKGNAALGNMTQVSVGSIAYTASFLRFALYEGERFTRTDVNADVAGFYSSLYSLLTDPTWEDEVQDLLKCWNRRVFPNAGRENVLSADSTMNFFNKAAAARTAA
ncbi:hypothetical protein EXIGLDRAFT_839087 [Exidia glandulosa HHB12029]|uniref:Uncharacterized protein n=1 Tax=Exidia glandulosa HHB12029 TaxID=1314781 RepID=A0A165F9F9_EXIGL|nr:hypothetical protein EXIGLDRAFT_839087 [Exidia glandulosa HHB12029]